MVRLAIANRGPASALAIFVLMATLGDAVYAARGVEPSHRFQLLSWFGTAFLIAHWVEADSRRLGVGGYLDQGLIMLGVWPIALPYYLFKTRQWRGFIALSGFAALFAITYAMALALFFALTALSDHGG